MLEELESTWAARWPGTPPVGHLLRGLHHDRWVRFHTLPESKRYPDSEAEYVTILDRHHALLEELQLADRFFVTSMLFAEDLAAVPPADSTLLPRAAHWRTLAPDDDEDLSIAVYASAVAYPSQELDRLLRAVADDQVGGMIIIPPDARWLYHPYDGGADVIAASPEARDNLREKFQSWLSSRPRGL